MRTIVRNIQSWFFLIFISVLIFHGFPCLVTESRANPSEPLGVASIRRGDLGYNQNYCDSYHAHMYNDVKDFFYQFPRDNDRIAVKKLYKDDKVYVYEIYSTETMDVFILKIKLSTGEVGYVSSSAIASMESYSDKGEIAKIHLHTPWEYEGDVDLIDDMIHMYEEFIGKYPSSEYLREAIIEAYTLQNYTLHLKPRVTNRQERIEKIISLFKRDFGNEDMNRSAKKIIQCIRDNNDVLIKAKLTCGGEQGTLKGLVREFMKDSPQSFGVVQHGGKILNSPSLNESFRFF